MADFADDSFPNQQKENGFTIAEGNTEQVDRTEFAGKGASDNDVKEVTTKVFVGQLDEYATAQDLRELFCKFGRVVEADVVKDYGFVHFAHVSDAEVAVNALDHTLFFNRKIRVEMSNSKVRTKPGMKAEGCFRCGKPGHWSKNCPDGPSEVRNEQRPRPRPRETYDMGARSRSPLRGYSERSYAPQPRYPTASYDRYYARPADIYRDYPPRDRYPPPPAPPVDRYGYYERERPAPVDPYYHARQDPYARPPPEYYRSETRAPYPYDRL